MHLQYLLEYTHAHNHIQDYDIKFSKNNDVFIHKMKEEFYNE